MTPLTEAEGHMLWTASIYSLIVDSFDRVLLLD